VNGAARIPSTAAEFPIAAMFVPVRKSAAATLKYAKTATSATKTP
jgi:hypothetical protein